MSHETDKSKEINGTLYTALRMPPVYSAPLFFKLTKLIAPMLKGLDTGKLEDAESNKEEIGLNIFAEILMNIDPSKTHKMIEEVLTNDYVQKEGTNINDLSDIDDGCPIEMIQVFAFVCQFQFGGSLAKMGKFKKLAGMMEKLKAV